MAKDDIDPNDREVVSHVIDMLYEMGEEPRATVMNVLRDMIHVTGPIHQTPDSKKVLQTLNLLGILLAGITVAERRATGNPEPVPAFNKETKH